jgi:hypothetical protein
MFPVIVDGELPYAQIGIKVANCDCPGCEITFNSTAPTIPCEGTELCCGDDCSGLASWAINIYDAYPFDNCCDVPCIEPIDGDSGVCPIVFTTDCLVADTYYAVVNLVDNVGLEQNYYAKIVVTGGATTEQSCKIVVTEGFEAPAPYCVIWATNPTATIGACTSIGPQPGDAQVTLIMAVAGTGSGTTTPAVGTYTLAYDYGEVVNISALANTGSVFTGWSANAAAPGAAATTVTMNGDQTATATFADVNDGPEAVDLGTARNFVILSKSGITNVPTSVITGDIGTSPITGASITGLDVCTQVTGKIYTVDVAGPACRVVTRSY